MKIGQILSGDTKNGLNEMKRELEKQRLEDKTQKRRRRKKKKKESLSFSDLRGLMSARSYYRGPGGAMKQRY